MNKFMNWYTTNFKEITWFIIGWLSLGTVIDFGHGDWFGVLVNVALIWLNLLISKNDHT